MGRFLDLMVGSCVCQERLSAWLILSQAVGVKKLVYIERR
jgi:hypothetical protein